MIFGDGQVGATRTTLYQVDDRDGSVRIEKITLFNDGADEQTIPLYVKPRNRPSRKLRQFILQQNEGGEYLEPGETLALEVGDAIEAEATVANAVDFIVFGEKA